MKNPDYPDKEIFYDHSWTSKDINEDEENRKYLEEKFMESLCEGREIIYERINRPFQSSQRNTGV